MASDRRLQVCFVCSGNICRSPMAEYVLRGLAERAGLNQLVEVDSAGTGGWHVGERADRRAREVLKRQGYDGSPHRARQFDPRWFASRDLVIALDHGHLRTLRSWASKGHERSRIRLLRSYDPAVGPDTTLKDLDVPDPYYDNLQAFADVLVLIESACAGLLDRVRDEFDGLTTSTA